MNDITYKEYLDPVNFFTFSENLKFEKLIDINIYNNLNIENKKKYLIEQNIFIKDELPLLIPGEIESNDEDFKEFDSDFVYNNLNYSLREDILEEFYILAYYSIEIYEILGNPASLEFEYIDFSLEQLLDDNQRLDFLKDYYKKYLNVFLKHTNRNPYLENSKGMTFDFKDYVINHFHGELFGFLTKGGIWLLRKQNDFTKPYGTLSNWCEMSEAKKIMNYCEKLIILFSSEMKKGLNLKPNKEDLEEKYYNPIFKGQKEETFFNEFLIVINAIDNKENPKNRKFNPCCAAIFYSEIELKKVIFKPNIDESDYLEYLVTKYPAGFNDINKPRLSDHSSQIDIIQPLLKENLTMFKKHKLDSLKKG